MSYILDALRKAEQQRQLGIAPRLLSVQATPERNTRPAFLFYGLTAVALTGAGVAIGWLQPWQQAPHSATESLVTRAPEPGPRPAMPPPQTLLPELSGPQQNTSEHKPLSAVESAPTIELESLKRDAPVPPKTLEPARKSGSKTAAHASHTTATPARETAAAPVRDGAGTHGLAATVPAAPAQAQGAVSVAELPLAIQREIPAMSIPVHTYSSTPKERIVAINGRLLQEGEYLAPGLKLEQIAPNGVIFSYKNYLFRQGL